MTLSDVLVAVALIPSRTAWPFAVPMLLHRTDAPAAHLFGVIPTPIRSAGVPPASR